MRQFQNTTSGNLRTQCSDVLRTHFGKYGTASAELDPKTLLSLLHVLRTQARRYTGPESSPNEPEIYARVLAQWTGYELVAARWITQALLLQEHRILSGAIAPLRAVFDRHGFVKIRPRLEDAVAAIGCISFYAAARNIPPSKVLYELFRTLPQPFDAAAAHRAYRALTTFVSHPSQTDGFWWRATRRNYDWARALEDAFDACGRCIRQLQRREAMELLAAIAREANSGAAKSALDFGAKVGSYQDAAEYHVLRRACMLLRDRTHLASPVRAIVVIAKLRAIAKSALLFRVLEQFPGNHQTASVLN